MTVVIAEAAFGSSTDGFDLNALGIVEPPPALLAALALAVAWLRSRRRAIS